MQTKSNIQLIKESLERKESFYNSMKDITDKYLVKDSVFEFNGNNTKEVVSGYMDIRAEYNNLNEAFDNLNEGEVIRVINNETYQIGGLCNSLSSAKYDKVYSIAFSEMVTK